MYNCTFVSNTANTGGGAYGYGCTFYNCLLTGNSASQSGGGANDGTLYNCTITGNSAPDGGGTRVAYNINCIIYSNTPANDVGSYAFTNCCIFPDPGIGTATITNNPGLIDFGSGYGTNHVAGNYRLTRDSPCRNTGANFSWMSDAADPRSKDLDGRARIKELTVDRGCYEYIPQGTIFSFH